VPVKKLRSQLHRRPEHPGIRDKKGFLPQVQRPEGETGPVDFYRQHEPQKLIFSPASGGFPVRVPRGPFSSGTAVFLDGGAARFFRYGEPSR